MHKKIALLEFLSYGKALFSKVNRWLSFFFAFNVHFYEINFTSFELSICCKICIKVRYQNFAVEQFERCFYSKQVEFANFSIPFQTLVYVWTGYVNK